MRRKFVLGVVMLLMSQTVYAQNFISQRFPSSSESVIGIHHIRHVSNTQKKYDELTGIYDLQGEFALQNNWFVGFSLPIIHTADNRYTYFNHQTDIGNVTLNVKKKVGDLENSLLSFSAYLPLYNRYPSDASHYSTLFHPYEQAKYVPATFSFKLNYKYKYVATENLLLSLELGPQLSTPMNFDYSSEILLNYNLLLGYTFNNIAAFVEGGGVNIFHQPAVDFEETYFWNIGLQFMGSRFQPGIFYGNNYYGDTFNFFDYHKQNPTGFLGIKLDYKF
ncbi:hypothetical protein WJR50_20970 [Catalinimonas sp. 4WD22]|uniref:hypothetical protein n=1 Tax=Catalinimonas locisalis TaxID=3133978 RepID=UPI003100DC45